MLGVCWIATLLAIVAAAFGSATASGIFLDAEEANTFLRRTKRSNSLFEEIQPGNRERECVEESCSYEEAREISDNTAIGQRLWIRYQACKREVIPVGRRRRRRQSTNQQKNELRRCLDDANQCQPNPCTPTNTMTCEDHFQNFRCVCRPGFEGKKCERAIDYCSTNDCDDGGTSRCENIVGTYRCVCNPGFTGDRCQTRLDHCLQDPCSARGTKKCINSPSSFRCACNEGYTGSRCEIDIDDCIGDPCLNGGTCIDGLNGFICVCDELHFGLTCTEEIDDCRNYGCSGHGECAPTDGSSAYSCQCRAGFEGPNCDEDIDECAGAPPCEQKCENTIGSFKCSCGPGYLVDIPDLYSCKDIDECTGAHGCDFQCINSVGSFRCTCEFGYAVDRLFGRYCEDIDECRTDNGGCAGKCVNGLGSFLCTCHEGFEPQDGGRVCADIDECSRNHGCEHRCENIPGSFQCICPEGYKLNYDKRTCRDVNECSLSTPPCDQKCRNFNGGYECSCYKGYAVNETGLCDDINECSDELNKCSDVCVNTVGSFRCECKVGFELVGTKCFNINDCRSNPCSHGRCFDGINSFKCTCSFGWSGTLCDVISDACSDAPCVNGDCEVSGASYTCTCNPGYTGTNCDVDMNECESGNVICNGQCVNTPGSFTCVCGEGFTSIGEACIDIDECVDPDACENECVNTQGSFHCMCGSGFTGILPNCEDIDECSAPENPCTQTCINNQGSFECRCSDGFHLNGTDSCTDIDECTEWGESPCSETCVNTRGSFECSCPPGRRLHDDGITCVAVAGCQGNPNVAFTGRNHLVLGTRSQDFVSKELGSTLKRRFYFSARFRTTALVGLVMGIADQSGRSSAYVMVYGGNVRAGMTSGGVYSDLVPSPDVHVADGEWHVVKIRASKSSIRLIVDGRTKSRATTSGTSLFTKGTLLHVGGIPSNHTLALQLGRDLYFKGCFAGAQTRPKTQWIPSKQVVYRSHVGCISDISPGGVYFYGTGYARFDAGQYRKHIEFKMRVKVRTSVGDGVIVAGSTRNAGSYVVRLQDGKVVAEVMGRDGTVVQSATYRNQEKMLCDGLWMTIYSRVSRGKVDLYVDGKPAQEKKRGSMIRFDTRRSSIFVGGLKDGALPHFKGSMKDLRINDGLLDIRDSKDYIGVNVMGMPPR